MMAGERAEEEEIEMEIVVFAQGRGSAASTMTPSGCLCVRGFRELEETAERNQRGPP